MGAVAWKTLIINKFRPSAGTSASPCSESPMCPGWGRDSFFTIGSRRASRGAISLVKRLSDPVLEDIEDKPTPLYFHHYRQTQLLSRPRRVPAGRSHPEPRLRGAGRPRFADRRLGEPAGPRLAQGRRPGRGPGLDRPQQPAGDAGVRLAGAAGHGADRPAARARPPARLRLRRMRPLPRALPGRGDRPRARPISTTGAATRSSTNSAASTSSASTSAASASKPARDRRRDAAFDLFICLLIDFPAYGGS